ncbi:hypothetical protein DPMN_092741 [Dreissena polymorpha]|uniref:Mab-21-like HhH/H2TH-like domain-containing protein n=2 Tax=Dreissena polymorpha TaxID=45954 RepID=A0A9D4L494_DREPO|nr:hypothetical protein DPMN_092741 [Dreissena polymorpha]
MTQLGYGEEIRRGRIERYRERDMLFNASSYHFTHFTAGSKAEGLTCWAESDHDWLHVLKDVVCVEAEVDLHTIPDHTEVYRMDTRTYPGHCRMLLERRASTQITLISNSLCDDGKGNALLSSSLFLDELSKIELKHGVRLERAGPSLPMSLSRFRINVDNVHAIHCQCPCILQRWAERPRHWPSPDVVLKVVSLGSFVTPNGLKKSEYKYLEWRICFNIGETELVNNLNGTQAKLYVILKMIVKEVLKPTNKEITSFVLKNIILWQAESNSPAMFQERNLIHWLHDALGTLRTVIASTQLPYYMIPERNLMADCGLHDEQQHKWVTDVTAMIEEGPRAILRLPKIRQAIICHPEPLLWFSRRRMELEMLQLELTKNCLVNYGECDDTDIILQIVRRMNEIVREVCLRMFIEGSTLNEIEGNVMEGVLSRMLM